jgi:hypothetical protein
LISRSLFAGDVEPDQEHAVALQPGSHDLGDLEHLVAHLGPGGLPPTWTLERASPSAEMRRNAAYLPSTTSGSPFMRKRRVSPSGGSRQILLRDHIAVARDGSII